MLVAFRFISFRTSLLQFFVSFSFLLVWVLVLSTWLIYE